MLARLALAMLVLVPLSGCIADLQPQPQSVTLELSGPGSSKTVPIECRTKADLTWNAAVREGRMDLAVVDGAGDERWDETVQNHQGSQASNGNAVLFGESGTWQLQASWVSGSGSLSMTLTC